MKEVNFNKRGMELVIPILSIQGGFLTNSFAVGKYHAAKKIIPVVNDNFQDEISWCWEHALNFMHDKR